MIFVGFGSSLPPPIWKTEKEHGAQVSHCPSMAATFIGWYVVSMTPRWLPTMSCRGATTIRKPSASFVVRRNSSGLLLCRRCQAETAEHDQRPGDQRREDHVGVAPDEDRVGEQRPRSR